MERIKIHGYSRSKWRKMYSPKVVGMSWLNWESVFDRWAVPVHIKGNVVLIIPLEIFSLVAKRVDSKDQRLDVGIVYRHNIHKRERVKV